MRPPLGSLAWTQQTNGLLSPIERIRLVGQATHGQVASGLAREHSATIRDEPKTPAARAALDLCRATCSASVLNHTLRTYAWAAAIAQQQEIPVDYEILYVAALLHDVGLFVPGASSPTCFTLESIAAVEEVGEAIGWELGRRTAASNAISMHMNLYVRQSMPPEAYLLAAGTHLDVVAERFRVLPRDVIDSVLGEHPRLGFKQEITNLFVENAAGNPGTRNAFYMRWLGTRFWIARSPFDE